MSNKFRFGLWCCGVLVLLFCGLNSAQFKIETNLLKLLPTSQYDPFVDLAFDRFANQNMQRLVFLIENRELARAKESANELVQLLKASPWINEVEQGLSLQQQQALAKINFDHRFHLLSNGDQKLLESGQEQIFVDDLITQLYSPINGGMSGLLQTDPFLLSYRYGISQSQKDQQLSLSDGYLVAENGKRRFVLITATINESPFLPELQQQLVNNIDQLTIRWAQQSASQLYRTGAVFYAAYAYKTAKGEISTIGVGSLLMILILILLVFRSTSPIILVSVALIFGIANGFLLVHFLYGEVHLLTLVFGASLVGVAVDYAFHYFASGSLQVNETRISKIFPAISLGLISSVVGYMALFIAPFPGLRQMAVFCSAGLVGAYLTVVLCFPIFNIKTSGAPVALRICSEILRLGKVTQIKWIVGVVIVAPFIAISLYQITPQSNDDIRQFQSSNESLETQRIAIEALLQAPAANQFYLVKGKSADELLVNLEKTDRRLNKLVEAKVINGYQSITQWLPSISHQQTNYQLITQLYASSAFNQLVELGIFSQSEVDHYRKTFESSSSNIIDAEQWLASSLGQQMSHLWLGKIDDEYASIVALKGINQLASLTDFSENSIFVDKVSNISNLFKQYRQSTSWLLLIAIGLIFLVLVVRYPIKKALLIIASPIVAISVTVIGLVALGEQVNLFNTLAFFLVVGIGIDYGLFFAESKSANPDTLLAVVMSALTTLFSFGLLSLSETAAIHAFGVTMLIGITCAFVLSPVIGNLLANSKDKDVVTRNT